jgi:heme exporter protein A
LSVASRHLQVQRLACIRAQRPVFARLDLEVLAGDALLLLGPNGSGKSSLLRLLAGLGTPAAGDILWNGTASSADRALYQQVVRYVGHHDMIKPVLTVSEHLACWAAMEGTALDGRALRAAMDFWGLLPLADRPARYLSAGQRRRLNLARLHPADSRPLWLLDEPNNALDTRHTERLGLLIDRHRQAGGIVIASAHGPLPILDARTLDLSRYAIRDISSFWGEGESAP